MWGLGVGWEGSGIRSWDGSGPLKKSTVPRSEGSAVEGQRAACCMRACVEVLQRRWLSPSLSHTQHLQEDRDGLHTTMELLQVRVQSLMHILAMQEEELARKVGPWWLSVCGRHSHAARTSWDLLFCEHFLL